MARENCEYYWVHFSGGKVVSFLAEGGLLSGVVSLGAKAHKVFELFENIVAAYNMEIKFVDDYANGLLIALISLIASPLMLPPPFYKAVKFLSDVQANFTIKEIASNIGMTESYFIRAFKKALGVTPLTFRNKKRMIVAKNLLRETDFSIHEIARLCGMDDNLYFSRFFKRFEGVSPLLYRQKTKML
jgi:AraC-like DNA-binding protein